MKRLRKLHTEDVALYVVRRVPPRAVSRQPPERRAPREVVPEPRPRAAIRLPQLIRRERRAPHRQLDHPPVLGRRLAGLAVQEVAPASKPGLVVLVGRAGAPSRGSGGAAGLSRRSAGTRGRRGAAGLACCSTARRGCRRTLRPVYIALHR